MFTKQPIKIQYLKLRELKCLQKHIKISSLNKIQQI